MVKNNPEFTKLKNQHKKLQENLEGERSKWKVTQEKLKEEQQEKNKKIQLLEKQKNEIANKLSKKDHEMGDVNSLKQEIEGARKEIKEKDDRLNRISGKMRDIKGLTNIISPLLNNKKYEPVKNKINKFITKNQNDELLESDIIILQHLLTLLQKEDPTNNRKVLAMEKEILELKEKTETQNEFLIFLERLVRKLDAKEDIDEDLNMISKGKNSPEAKQYRLILRFKEKLEGNAPVENQGQYENTNFEIGQLHEGKPIEDLHGIHQTHNSQTQQNKELKEKNEQNQKMKNKIAEQEEFVKAIKEEFMTMKILENSYCMNQNKNQRT